MKESPSIKKKPRYRIEFDTSLNCISYILMGKEMIVYTFFMDTGNCWNGKTAKLVFRKQPIVN